MAQAAEVDLVLNDARGDHGTQFWNELDFPFEADPAAADPDHTASRLHRWHQFILSVPTLDEYLRAWFPGLQIFHHPDAIRGFQGNRRAHGHGHVAGVSELNGYLDRGFAISRKSIFGNIDSQPSQLAGRDHLDLLRTTIVAPWVKLAEGELILARQQIDSDEFPDFQLLSSYRSLAAYLFCRKICAVDVELEGVSHLPFHA